MITSFGEEEGKGTHILCYHSYATEPLWKIGWRFFNKTKHRTTV